MAAFLLILIVLCLLFGRDEALSMVFWYFVGSALGVVIVIYVVYRLIT